MARPVTAAERRRILAMHRDGEKLVVIAATVGRPVSTVHDIASRAGLKRGRGHRASTAEERAAWQRARDAGATLEQIAEGTRWSRATVGAHTAPTGGRTPRREPDPPRKPRRMDAQRPEPVTDRWRRYRLRLAPRRTERESFAQCWAEALAEGLPPQHRREALRLLSRTR